MAVFGCVGFWPVEGWGSGFLGMVAWCWLGWFGFVGIGLEFWLDFAGLAVWVGLYGMLACGIFGYWFLDCVIVRLCDLWTVSS